DGGSGPGPRPLLQSHRRCGRAARGLEALSAAGPAQRRIAAVSCGRKLRPARSTQYPHRSPFRRHRQMKSTLSRLLGIALVVFASMTWVVDAEAPRLGGGKTFGRQSDVTQRQATPPAAAAAPTQAARPAATGGSRWMAPIAGLAAGLGLAALASWLGFGEELANFMLIALLVIAA